MDWYFHQLLMISAYAAVVQQNITLAINEMFGQLNDTAPNNSVPTTAERRAEVQ